MSSNKQHSIEDTKVNRRTVYRVFKRLETIKEMPDESDSLNEKSPSLRYSQSSVKSRRTITLIKHSSSLTKHALPRKRIRSYNNLSKEETTTEVIAKKTKTTKDERCTIEELEIEEIKERNYKNRGNFALLQLTNKSANVLGCKVVAAPLKPYSIDQLQREIILQGNNSNNIIDVKELLADNIKLVASTSKIKTMLQLN